MTKKENLMMDAELDMVVGGATTLLLKKREDGIVEAFLVSAKGDAEGLKKLLNGGAVDKIEAGGEIQAVELRRGKENAWIERKKKAYPDLVIEWIK